MLYYGDRKNIPQNVLQTEVKKVLDDQWSRLNFGKTIHNVIPFLPLEREQIKEIFALKLTIMAAEHRLGLGLG
jgi:ATP-dependent Clp protease ATP-binding subunit ClpA